MTESHAAAARAVSRLEPADDGAALLADPRDRGRIATALTIAILGVLTIALGEHLTIIVDAVASLIDPPAADDTMAPSVFVRADWSFGVGDLTRSFGFGLMLFGVWSCARAPRAAPRSPLLSSPRRILRISAAVLLCNQAVDLFTAGLAAFGPVGSTSAESAATLSELLDATIGLAAIPAFLAAVLVARALARASGAPRTDAWFARLLWILPLLIFTVPFAIMLVMVLINGVWFGFSELLGVDPVVIARDASTLALLIALRRAVGRSAGASPLSTLESEKHLRCLRCAYRLDPAASTSICPECGGDADLFRQSPPWLRTARRGVTLILVGSFAQFAAWVLLDYLDRAHLRTPRLRAEAWTPYLSDILMALTVLAASLPLVNILGWWSIASRATPATLDRRERQLRSAARVALIASAAVVLASIIGIMFDLFRTGRWELRLVWTWLAFSAAALWWWPAAGRTVRAALDVNAPRTARVALTAFWLLPCLAWPIGVFQTAFDGVYLWAALAEIVNSAWREEISPEMIANFAAPSRMTGMFSAIATASTIACALAYLTYLFTLHRAFRRAERRAGAP